MFEFDFNVSDVALCSNNRTAGNQWFTVVGQIDRVTMTKVPPMTLVFNSAVLPHADDSVTFGFVQTRYSPESSTPFPNTLPKCRNCTSILFPTADDSLACPVCAPDSSFKTDVLAVGPALASRSLFFFVFDLSLPIQRAQTLLRAFSDCLSDTDIAVVLSISGSAVTLLYVEDQIPFFAAASRDFLSTDLYEMGKAELASVLIPALPALYTIQPPNLRAQPIDVLAPLQICVRQAERRPFAVFFFLTSPVGPITAERAAAASRTVAASGGVVHFGATEHFKRLSAISHCNFGGGKAGINDLVEICLSEKKYWIMWRSGSEEKWRLDKVNGIGKHTDMTAEKVVQWSKMVWCGSSTPKGTKFEPRASLFFLLFQADATLSFTIPSMDIILFASVSLPELFQLIVRSHDARSSSMNSESFDTESSWTSDSWLSCSWAMVASLSCCLETDSVNWRLVIISFSMRDVPASSWSWRSRCCSESFVCMSESASSKRARSDWISCLSFRRFSDCCDWMASIISSTSS
jgi:hypothetical protein